MITDKYKIDLFQEIIDDAIKPMSIKAIKEKWNLSFPFQVKRVKDSIGNGSWKGVTTITGLYPCKFKGRPGLRTNNTREAPPSRNAQCAEVEDYILYEKI